MGFVRQVSGGSYSGSPRDVHRSAGNQTARSRGLLTLVGFYLVGSVIGVGIFVLGFISKGFSFIPIFFYRGLVIIAAAAVLHAVIMALVLRRIGTGRLSPANLVSVVAMSAMLNLTFFTLVPVNLDRSISVFLLAWMGNTDAPMTDADLQDVFQTVYVGRYQAIDRRVKEQLASGNIKITSRGFVLTERGRMFDRFAKTVGLVFSVDPRFLDPSCAASEKAQGLAGCKTATPSRSTSAISKRMITALPR